MTPIEAIVRAPPFIPFVFSGMPNQVTCHQIPRRPTAPVPIAAKLILELHLVPFPLISSLRIQNAPETIAPLNGNSREVPTAASFSTE